MESPLERGPVPAPHVLERERPARASWNPLAVSGTALPPNVLLAAKLIALSFIATGQVQALPSPFLPFVAALDGLPLQPVLQALFLTAATALLLNRAVRTCCLVLGTTLFVALLSSRLYFENNRTFTACVLFLTGLYEPRQRHSLIRLQLVVLYFGAALNKVLDPDWRSGQFFENWVTHVLRYPGYARFSGLLPPLALSALLDWLAIATEAALALGFLVPRLRRSAIVLGVLWHTGLLLLTGRTFGMFFYALLSAYLAVAPWPRAPLTLLYTPARRVAGGLRSLLQRLDFDRSFRWVPRDDAAARGPGRRANAYQGLAAYAAALRYTPATYFALLLGVLMLRPLSQVYRSLLM